MNVLFVHNHRARFVQIDLSLLRERYRVEEWYQRGRTVSLPKLTRSLSQNDWVVGWFASWHTLFPVLLARILKRPSILIIGGYDTANLPEIGYGSQRGGIKRWMARTTMNFASRLITNSFYARDEAVRNAGVDPEKIAVIHHGFDLADSPHRISKENMAITVANVDRDNLHRKGLAPFVRAAALLPDIPFVLIGAWRDDAIEHLRSFAPANVQFTGRLDDAALSTFLARARVYVQASRHEAFGMALAEAMLSECVPVVTRAGALPEVVGETGIYIDSAEPQIVAEGIRRAITCDDGWGNRARTRIINEFPLERRRKGLYSVIEKTLEQHG